MSLKEDFLRKINNGVVRGAQAVLAEKLGVSQTAVGHWIKGLQFPSEPNIMAMARLVHWPEDKVREMFAEGAPDYVHENKPTEVMLIPVLGVSSATDGKFILEELESYLPIKKSSKKQFAVRVEGNCMVDPQDPAGSIYNGNYIIVNPEVEPLPGDVVLARIDGEYSTIKRFYPKGKTVKLSPDNPAYKPLVYPARQVEIIGKVTDIYRPAKRKKERD